MNAPDRYESFLLGEGEKKVEVEQETRVPNASMFTFNKEDHTLGNLLRAKLVKADHVLFAGYQVPHPLFATFKLRVQTDGEITPKEAVVTACQDLVKELGQLDQEFTKEMELKKIAGAGGDFVVSSDTTPCRKSAYITMGIPLRDSETDQRALADATGDKTVHEDTPRSPASKPCQALESATPSISGPASASPEHRFQPQPVIDIPKYNAFPPAARKREIERAVRSFTGNAQNMFVHHVESVLRARRRERLAQKTTKKLYSKTAAQVWPHVSQEQAFFWRQKAVELRLALSHGILEADICLADAGWRDEWVEYRRFAEMAVANYLQQEVPEEFREEREKKGQDRIVADDVVPECVKNSAIGQTTGCNTDEVERTEDETDAHIQSSAISTGAQDDLRGLSDTLSKLDLDKTILLGSNPVRFVESTSGTDTLLDVLPARFHYEPRMMYGNFAHADYNEIRSLQGKQQAARLRQLANLFDTRGKTLFYYYAYPHVYKRLRPPDVDQTVASVVHDKWRLMGVPMKTTWQTYGRRVTKLLGDGNVDGLDLLELDGTDPDVFELHRKTEEVLG
ncbi:hypothetical protein BST61_g10032 [Cercospora zeina]